MAVLRLLQQEDILRLLAAVAAIVLASATLLFAIEPQVSFVDGIWWSLVTITTVGYGDVTPVTAGGRLVAAADMLVGIGIPAVLTARIASVLVEQKNREFFGMSSFTFRDHLIICGWNPRAQDILTQLRCQPKTAKLPVVLIADIDRKPSEDSHLSFVRGEVCDETLARANLAAAATAIVLGDDSLDRASRDARTVMATLTIESINPHAYTIVELATPAYADACRRAKADEVVIASEIGSRLMLSAVLIHKVSHVITELLCYSHGNTLDKIAISDAEVGITFVDLLARMKREQNCIVLGVETGATGTVLSNPAADYILQANDCLIVIRPQIDSEPSV